MRTSCNIGDANEFGVRIIGGPYSGQERGRATKWEMLCPFCNQTFMSPTTRFKTAKSCYNCRGKNLRRSEESSTWSYLYAVLKGRKNAQEKGFNLTKEEFIELSSMNCFYCGQLPKETGGRHEWHPMVLANGLDRVDPSRGYLVDNVVPCCGTCNVAKLAMKREEFFAWIVRVQTHQNLTMSRSTSTAISA